MVRSTGAARGAVSSPQAPRTCGCRALPELPDDAGVDEATENTSAAMMAKTRASDDGSDHGVSSLGAQRPCLLSEYYIGRDERPVKGRGIEGAA